MAKQDTSSQDAVIMHLVADEPLVVTAKAVEYRLRVRIWRHKTNPTTVLVQRESEIDPLPLGAMDRIGNAVYSSNRLLNFNPSFMFVVDNEHMEPQKANTGQGFYMKLLDVVKFQYVLPRFLGDPRCNKVTTDWFHNIIGEKVEGI